jgi:hypothetical protein
VREIVNGNEVALVWHIGRRRKFQLVGVTSLSENHVLPGLSRYFSYHHCLISITPYKDLFPDVGGDPVVSADVYGTNTPAVDGVTDPLCHAICSCSQYTDTQIARRERHVLPLNGKTFLCCAIDNSYRT